jgi:hypothetical protein
MISQPWHPLCSLACDSKGAYMAKRNTDQTSRDSSRDTMDQDDRVRGRADEMEDAAADEDFDESDDLDDGEDEEEGEGSF